MNSIHTEEFPAGAIILVNVVHVNAGCQELAVSALEETVKYVASRYAGFQWSRLLSSVDGKTVINQAVWSSESEFQHLFSDDGFLLRYNKLKEAGTWEYHLYRQSKYITPTSNI